VTETANSGWSAKRVGHGEVRQIGLVQNVRIGMLSLPSSDDSARVLSQLGMRPATIGAEACCTANIPGRCGQVLVAVGTGCGGAGRARFRLFRHHRLRAVLAEAASG